MPKFYTPSQVQQLAATNFNFANTRNAKYALDEAVPTKHPYDWQTFDIFLSYRFNETTSALAIYTDLKRRGYEVYLDQVMDPDIDRSNVTATSAERIRKRLIQSKSLFYIATDDSGSSKWMPWELGFEDGYRGKSAIVPVTNDSNFKGTEFVCMYSRVQPDPTSLWIYKPDNTLDAQFEIWRDRIPDRKCGMPKCPMR